MARPFIKDEGVFVNVMGVNNVVTALGKINQEVEKQLAIKMARVVLIVGQSAKGYAAVDTGFMKANIKGAILRKRSVIIGRVKSKARYSIYQEFGSSRNAEHPFMRPGLYNNRERIRSILEQAVIDGVVTSTKKYTRRIQKGFLHA